MKSHTVPKKLLEQFAYSDSATQSNRLYRYEKDRAPRWDASPKTAARWNGHFADPANAAKEELLEFRLKQEFEDPVNQFIETIGASFVWNDEKVRLLTGYIRMLFNRSKARQEASAENAKTKIDAFRNLLANEERVAQIAHRHTTEMIEMGIPITRVVASRDVKEIIKQHIAEHSRPDEPQRDYIQALETMMTFRDEGMLRGQWDILITDASHPFVIGDAPVVTMERTEGKPPVLWHRLRPPERRGVPSGITDCLYSCSAAGGSYPGGLSAFACRSEYGSSRVRDEALFREYQQPGNRCSVAAGIR